MLTAYHNMIDEDPSKNPSVREVARRVKVSHCFAYKVLDEFCFLGYIEDPKGGASRSQICERYTKIHPEAAIFLLALRYKDDQRLLYSYQSELVTAMGLYVSSPTVNRF